MTPRDELSPKIAALISETLQIEVPAHETDLIETGLIDSLALVTLITEIEAEFEVQLPLDEFDVESVRSVDQLAGYVSTHLPGGGG